MAAVPLLIVAAILAFVGILGFGAGNGISKEQVQQEVAALLTGIPQEGAILGSSRAPITVRVFADLECPTVKRFVVAYLPSIIHTWVRNGDVKLEYRSLETDTLNEHTFFQQEVAALAAGRQDKMWNYLLTFVHEQKLEYTGYATNEFLIDIATQVPDMKLAKWRRDRSDASLAELVALDAHAARAQGFRFTPSFLLSITGGKLEKDIPARDIALVREEVEVSLRRARRALNEISGLDDPAVRVELEERKEVKELKEK
jgi:protein-disulfide isomerase